MWTSDGRNGPRAEPRKESRKTSGAGPWGGILSTWLLVVAIIAGALLAGCGDAGSAESELVEPAGLSSSDSSSSEPAVTEAASAEPATVGDLFPEGLGRQLVLDACGVCHAVACSAIGQRPAARWDNLKEDHRDKASGLSEEELETLFAYLKEHFSDSKPEPRVPPRFLEAGCTPF